MTSNHDYETPAEGTVDWHLPLNRNFASIDTDVEIRDVESEREQYTPKAGAKFFAVDTGVRYLGDGSEWTVAPSQPLSEVVAPHTQSDPENVASGQVWYRSDLDELRIRVGSETKTLAGPSGQETQTEPTANLVWRNRFDDPESEALKDFNDRNRDRLHKQLANTGWDHVNNHVHDGMYYTQTSVSGSGVEHAAPQEGSHSWAFHYHDDKQMGCDLRKRLGVTEAWAQYWLRIPDGFDATNAKHASWADGGKLPGWHMTKDISQTEPGKAWLTFHDPDREGYADHDKTGNIHLNYYVENANERDAGTEPWNENGIITPGEWHELTLYANTNTGELRAWVNGTKAFDRSDHNWNGRDLGWAHISHFGGGWYSPTDQSAFVDDLRIYSENPL